MYSRVHPLHINDRFGPCPAASWHSRCVVSAWVTGHQPSRCQDPRLHGPWAMGPGPQPHRFPADPGHPHTALYYTTLHYTETYAAENSNDAARYRRRLLDLWLASRVVLETRNVRLND